MKSQKVPRSYTKKASRKDPDGNPIGALTAGAPMGTSSRGAGSTRGKKRRLAAGDLDSRTIVASNPFDDEPSSVPLNHLHHQVHYQQQLSQPPHLQQPGPMQPSVVHHHHHHQPQSMLIANTHHPLGHHPHHHQGPPPPPPPQPHHPHAASHNHHPHNQQQHPSMHQHAPQHDFHSPQPQAAHPQHPLHLSSPGPPSGYVSAPLPPGSPAVLGGGGGATPVYSPAPPTLGPPRMGGGPPPPPGPHMVSLMQPQGQPHLATPPHMVCNELGGLPPPQPMHHQSPGMGTPSPRPAQHYGPPGAHFPPGPGAGPFVDGAAPTMTSPTPPQPIKLEPVQVAGPSPNLQQQQQQQQHLGAGGLAPPPPPSQMGAMHDQMGGYSAPSGQTQMLVCCSECRQPIYPNEHKILCRAGCDNYYHRQCSGLSELACELLLRESAAEWVCNRCVCGERRIPVVRMMSQQPDCRQTVWL